MATEEGLLPLSKMDERPDGMHIQQQPNINFKPSRMKRIITTYNENKNNNIDNNNDNNNINIDECFDTDSDFVCEQVEINRKKARSKSRKRRTKTTETNNNISNKNKRKTRQKRTTTTTTNNNKRRTKKKKSDTEELVMRVNKKTSVRLLRDKIQSKRKVTKSKSKPNQVKTKKKKNKKSKQIKPVYLCWSTYSVAPRQLLIDNDMKVQEALDEYKRAGMNWKKSLDQYNAYAATHEGYEEIDPQDITINDIIKLLQTMLCAICLDESDYCCDRGCSAGCGGWVHQDCVISRVGGKYKKWKDEQWTKYKCLNCVEEDAENQRKKNNNNK